MYRFTSAIRRVLGSAARTKTPMGCCGNTCQRNQIYLSSLNRSWMQSPSGSIPGRDKPWDFELRRINCRPVLPRPRETTRVIVIWFALGSYLDENAVYQDLAERAMKSPRSKS